MIKNNFNKIVLGVALTATSLLAGMSESEFNTNSLVGIEGGYSTLDYENGTSLNNEQYDVQAAHAGLKIGAETKDFRIFISGRYFFDSSKDYDYISTYGVELQYKLNVTKVFNFYLGANTGVANMKFRGKGENFSRTISDSYVGGDLGANIHLTRALDWEIGGRFMSIQADNTKNNVTYSIGNLVTGYTSLIFKWQMK